MTEKEAQEILDELNTVRPEMLNENAKRLFEAIMKIADERDKANNIIKEVREYIEHNKIYTTSGLLKASKTTFGESILEILDKINEMEDK